MPGISVIGGGSSYKVVSENKHPLFANSPRSKLFWHAIDYIKNFNIDLNNAILKTDKLGKEIIGWEATTCQAFRALDEHSIAGWFGGKHLSKEQTVLLAVCYFLGHISSSIDSAASCEVVQEEALRKWIGGLKDGVVNINIDSSYLSEVKVAPNNDIVIVDQPYPLISWKKLQSYATAYADKYPLKRIHFKTIIDNKSLYDNSDTQSGPRCISLGRIFLLDLMLKSTTVLFRKPIKNAYINLLTISPSGSLSEEAVKRSNELLYPDNKEFSNRFQAIQDICATNSRELDQITLAHALLFSVVLMKKSSLPQLYIECLIGKDHEITCGINQIADHETKFFICDPNNPKGYCAFSVDLSPLNEAFMQSLKNFNGTFGKVITAINEFLVDKDPATTMPYVPYLHNCSKELVPTIFKIYIPKLNKNLSPSTVSKLKNDFSDQFFKDIAKIESKEQLEIGIKCQNMAMIKNACDAGKICAYRTAIIHAVYWKTPLTVFRSIITINKEYIDESEDAPESLARSKDALIYAIEKKLYDHLKCLLEYNPNTNLANSYLYYYPDATAKKILQEHSKKQARKIS